jgi:hypothetical protein
VVFFERSVAKQRGSGWKRGGATCGALFQENSEKRQKKIVITAPSNEVT